MKATLTVSSRKSRRGTAADRGKVIRWPEPASGAAGESQRKPPLHSLRRLGPGVVTGAANVDPSLVVTATVAGAAYHYSVLWVVLLCVPILIAVYACSSRIGYETRKGLVDLLRENYGQHWAIACAAVVIVINMAMIIADLMAVSDAFSIILNQRRAFFVGAVAFSVWYILIFRDYRKITRALLWLSLPLFVYVASAVIATPSPLALLHRTFLPQVVRSGSYVAAVVAIFGSLLTPYILVWQTSSRREHAVIGEETPHMAQSRAGTVVTTLLSFSIIIAAGAVLHLSRPVEMTTRQAAEALHPAAGDYGQFLFALGIIGAGMVALPVLVASLCYSLAEAMGWRAGLSEHPWEAKRFYGLISAAVFVAAAANFLPINPVKALFWSQILAGVLTIPVLLFILLLSNDRRVMHTTNTAGQNFWIGAGLGGLVAAAIVWVWWGLG